MNRLPASAHRLSTALAALALIVVGGGAIAWRTGLQPIAGWVGDLDQTTLERTVSAPWWTWVLIATTLVALGWGLLLLSTNIRPRAVDDVDLQGSDETGTLTVSPKLIASAVADQLEATTLLQRVSAKAIDDRARSIIRVEVTARPTRTYEEISRLVQDSVETIRSALGESDVHVQALVHFER